MGVDNASIGAIIENDLESLKRLITSILNKY
jgi:hypothetical protein